MFGSFFLVLFLFIIILRVVLGVIYSRLFLFFVPVYQLGVALDAGC